MSDRKKIDQRLKNKIVSAILSYPPDTMSKAEFMADEILAALEPAPQAGGDVRERVYKIVCTHRYSTTPDQFTDMIFAALTKGGEGDE